MCHLAAGSQTQLPVVVEAPRLHPPVSRQRKAAVGAGGHVRHAATGSGSRSVLLDTTRGSLSMGTQLLQEPQATTTDHEQVQQQGEFNETR